MEDDFDLETMRLKRLLEDSILKVEKENLELIQNRNLDTHQSSKNIQVPRKQQSTTSSSIMPLRSRRVVYNAKSTSTNAEDKSHPQSSQCMRHYNPRIDGNNSHANVHFLNDLQSSLLVSNMKKRVLQNEVKSRYTPCAVPLSPPIRIRKENNESFSDPTPHTSNHVSHAVPKKKLVIQSPVPSKRVSPVPIIKDFQQNLSDSFSKSPAPTEKYAPANIIQDYFRNASDSLSKVRFESPENSASFKSIGSNISSNKRSPECFSQPAAKEYIPKPINEQKSSDDNANGGFNLHISLDSISTKDVINQLLQKIPEFIDGLTSNIASATKSNSTEKKNYEDKLQFEFKTQPNSANSLKNFASQNQYVSTSTQTDILIEISENQTGLRDLVKEVVLDTLKDMKLPEHALPSKVLSIRQKIDSGIQSEVETDVPDSDKNFQMQFPGNGVLLNEKNTSSQEQISVISKGIQVSMNPNQRFEDQITYDENYSKETYDSAAEDSDGNVLHNFQKLKERDNVPERTSFLPYEPQKVELMLEKIYEHVCQEKEHSHNYPAISQSCSIVTRDVAVQFNPLHTSTKSTLTTEIRKMDSYCQYDILLEDSSKTKSYANAFVQATSFMDTSISHKDQQVNAYTQCVTKTFLDTDVQTEMMNSEYSATNTSVPSTPGSDSMFMDDLLSEGEITLPWNLRLLSFSDRVGASNLNIADSSDISSKGKDYSLSEGEIHPNIVHYLNINESEGNNRSSASNLNIADSSDISPKERDHSLSEGEIHPNLGRYLNVCQSNESEGNDFDHEIYSSEQIVDSKLQSSSRSVLQNYSSYNFMCSSNMHPHLSSPLSDGEINSNTSISLGEVPSDFMIPVAESSHISDDFSPQNASHDC